MSDKETVSDQEAASDQQAQSDLERATQWDADHRLAASAAFVAGVVVVGGAALWFTLGMYVAGRTIEGQSAGAFLTTLAAGVLLLTDVALLVFVVGLSHALTQGQSFARTATTAVATLATTASATLHLVWGHMPVTYEVELSPASIQFTTWLAVNLWMLPLFGVLVGATLVALGAALRSSEFRFSQRLGTASLVVGAILCVLGPLTGFEPGQMAWASVVATVVATGGISALLAVALVRLGSLLMRTRQHRRHEATV